MCGSPACGIWECWLGQLMVGFHLPVLPAFPVSLGWGWETLGWWRSKASPSANYVKGTPDGFPCQWSWLTYCCQRNFHPIRKIRPICYIECQEICALGYLVLLSMRTEEALLLYYSPPVLPNWFASLYYLSEFFFGFILGFINGFHPTHFQGLYF